MAGSAIYQLADYCLRYAAVRFVKLRLAVKLAAAASISVACAAAYIGTVVSQNARDNTVQQAAAEAALYMDSFVASHVQELATKDNLSAENRDALERLLSPASMNRPIVAFRIWKGDTIAYSNERALIGKSLARSEARERAMQGQIGVEFDIPSGDDDAQVRSLKVPVLEVYAPVREKGTGRIIAIAETYEIAIELTKEVWTKQLTTWVLFILVTLALNVLLFAMAGTGKRERNSLLGRIGELSESRRRIAYANMKVSEQNEQWLRRVEKDLRHGPLQNVTLALLKLDPAHWIVRNGLVLDNATNRMDDIVTVREALKQTMQEMRGVCTGAVPASVAQLSTGEALASAAREHHRRTGLAVEYDFDGMPEQLPFALKVCLYRILLEGLHSTAAADAQPQLVRGSLASKTIVLEVICSESTVEQVKLIGVRDRVEALGGTLHTHCTPGGPASLIVEVNLSDMGLVLG